MPRLPQAVRFGVRVTLWLVLVTAVVDGSAWALGGDCMQESYFCWAGRTSGWFGLTCRDLPYGVPGSCGGWQDVKRSSVVYGKCCIAIVVT